MRPQIATEQDADRLIEELSGNDTKTQTIRDQRGKTT